MKNGCRILLPFAFSIFPIPSNGSSSWIQIQEDSKTAVSNLQSSNLQSANSPQKSPTRAMISSLLLPGGGQFYTENYKKGILFGLAQGTLSGMTLYQHMKTEKAWDRFEKSGMIEDYNSYSDHFDRRKTLLLADIGVWILSIADAYISAHFYEFDRLSLSLSPNPTLSAVIRF